MEDLILPDDRERAIRLAGHDYKVVERQSGNVLLPVTDDDLGRVLVDETREVVRVDGQWYWFDRRAEEKGLYIEQLRDGEPGPVHGNFLKTMNESWTVIPNSVGWEVMEAIVGAGAKLDTGLTLKDGAVAVVTAFLDEPVQIKGDNSPILPYLVARWAHDGSASLSTRATSVRVVCSNTDDASIAEASRLGTDFTFRHTANWREKVEDAKMAVKGLRDSFEEYTELANELADLPVTAAQRELFVTTFLPKPPEALISERVGRNVEEARKLVRDLFDGPTIPDEHRLTAYGLRLAGVEYLDHLRGYRDQDSYVGRQLLRREPAKVKLASLIKDVVSAEPSAAVIREMAAVA